MSVPGQGGEQVDVLVVTAIKLEYDALLQVDAGAVPDSTWERRPGPTGFEVAFRAFHTAEGDTLRFAATYALEMGGVATASAAAPLALVYQPRCLAMCGVCAGRRGDVRLGDVIIGDRLWTYDTGATVVEKDAEGREVERFKADPFQYNLHAVWKQRAESFWPEGAEEWLADRPRSYDEQGDWLMARLLAGDDPRTHAERRVRCADFAKIVALLRKRGWLEPGGLCLSVAGRADIDDKMLLHPEGMPEREDFAIHVGPIGTGTKVVRDPHIFDKLSERMRKVIGLEMEAAAIGAIAHQHDVERMIVMKGVMDHADPDKNDNFKEFGARASAECMVAFLRQNLPAHRGKEDSVPDKVREVITQGADLLDGRQLAQAKVAFQRALKLAEEMNHSRAIADSKEQLIRLAQAYMEAARKAAGEQDFEPASFFAEESAELANKGGDGVLERRGRLAAVHLWGERVAMSRLDEVERERVLSRIRTQLRELESLDIRPSDLALEKARLGLFEEDGKAALGWAQEAMSGVDGGTREWVDALIFSAQAYWVLGTPEEALSLAGFKELARSNFEASAIWLRTLCKAGKATPADVGVFCDLVRALASNGLDRRRAISVIDQVKSEFGRARSSSERLALCKLGYEFAEYLHDATMAASIALEAAELAADCGGTREARLYLGKASSWLEHAKTDRESIRRDASWPTLRALHLLGKGRTLYRLSGRVVSGDESVVEILREAMQALEEAETVVSADPTAVRGDVEIFLADVRWWRGRTAYEMNRWEEAATLFKKVRSNAAMAHPRFSLEVGMHAWLLEAEALYQGGHSREAAQVVDSLLEDPRAGSTVGPRASDFRQFLAARILPLFDWYTSTQARAIESTAKVTSLRHAVATELHPLVSWWAEWTRDGECPHSELFDFWGRGGFSRVAAAIRARPNAAIAVDARSIDEIRLWARAFCPLFDTVLVKWKGEIAEGMVTVPIDRGWGGEEAFGGHGYTVTSSLAKSPVGRDWAVALGWANPLPSELSTFLATEALKLVSTGRLLVIPAPLVGCTQTAVGWTDHLLVEIFLGGVVNVIGKQQSAESASGRRVLDLSRLSIPYIDDVPLVELADVLEEMSDWLHPLRSLLFRSMLNDDLRHERWDAIRALESDFADACNNLRERLARVARPRHWTVMEAPGSVSAATRGGEVVAHEPVTDLLRAIAPVGQELAPWIPYWRLRTAGGRLDWTCPLDNPSKPSETPSVPRELQTWIWPGTRGWGFASARL